VRRDGESGSMTIEMVIIVPMLLLIGGLVLVGGYLASASGVVQSAANEAARTASLARDAETAARTAETTARSTLANSDAPCSNPPTVTPDVKDFNQPLGVAGEVTITVSCEVRLSVLGLPKVGTQTVTATASSAIDAYRARN
jgi:Flp pilus assembly protein TadG